MPHKLALNLHEFEVIVVHLGDDLWRPLVGKLRKLLGKVDWPSIHSRPPSGRLTPISAGGAARRPHAEVRGFTAAADLIWYQGLCGPRAEGPVQRSAAGKLFEISKVKRFTHQCHRRPGCSVGAIRTLG